MDRSLLQLALREMQGVFTSRITPFAMLVAIVVLTVSGPFGTFQTFNLGERLAYWTANVVLSYSLGQGTAKLLLGVLKRWISERWLRAIVSALLSALPVTVVVVAVNAVAYRRFEWDDVLPIWLYVTLVTLVIVIALVALDVRLQAVEPAAAAAAPGLPPILERVPLPQRGRLLALSVEDHYVDIVTDKGKALVLMRLADAIRETGSVEGLQIHRSHWVARAAVVKTHRSDGKLLLELSTGVRLPVSRSYLPAVREAGLG